MGQQVFTNVWWTMPHVYQLHELMVSAKADNQRFIFKNKFQLNHHFVTRLDNHSTDCCCLSCTNFISKTITYDCIWRWHTIVKVNKILPIDSIRWRYRNVAITWDLYSVIRPTPSFDERRSSKTVPISMDCRVREPVQQHITLLRDLPLYSINAFSNKSNPVSMNAIRSWSIAITRAHSRQSMAFCS